MRSIFAFLAVLFAFQVAQALPTGWQEIAPGGDTMCAHGTAYKFLVFNGDPQKILVSFAGGGACWDDFTCARNQIYTDTVERTYGPINNQEGIYDLNSTTNPYKGWTQIFIPYCTGDVHLGSADTTYKDGKGGTFVIRHRGGNNVRAVLQWLTEHYPTAAEINIDGCSAGSYGSIVWMPKIAESYKNAKILQFGDSGAGVSQSLFFPQWGVDRNLPAWVPGLDPTVIDWKKLSLVDVYRSVASYYPNANFSQFNHDQDRIQTLFYAATGGPGNEWSERMFKSMESISVSTVNFRYFVAPGKQHCAITNSSLYTTKSDGVVLADWLGTAVSGQDSQNVKCLECKTNVK
jgi:pectinacetylesterase